MTFPSGFGVGVLVVVFQSSVCASDWPQWARAVPRRPCAGGRACPGKTSGRTADRLEIEGRRRTRVTGCRGWKSFLLRQHRRQGNAPRVIVMKNNILTMTDGGQVVL